MYISYEYCMHVYNKILRTLMGRKRKNERKRDGLSTSCRIKVIEFSYIQAYLFTLKSNQDHVKRIQT